MKKVYLILIVMLLFLGCKSEEKTTIKNEENKEYSVAINFEYYPFSYKDESTEEPQGFIYEISKEIERRANFTVHLQEEPISKIIDEITNGNYDVGIMAFAVTEERNKKIDFSETLYNSEIVILGNRNIAYQKDIQIICGVQANSIFEKKFEEIDKDWIIVRDRDCRLVEALVNKDIDYIVTYSETANNLIEKHPELFKKETLGKMEIAFIMSKDLNKNAFKKVNSIISDMKLDGTMERLKKKYNLVV